MTLTSKQRLSQIDGVPSRDDDELAVLMEAVRRLPAPNAHNVIESLLRGALGFERTGSTAILTALAEGALVTFRSRRDAEDQKALDAPPPESPASGEVGTDVDEVFARHGL